MKKFLSGLIAAFLLSAGFVAVSGEVATAAPSARACTPTKYVKCPTTKSKATTPKSSKRGKKVKGSVVVSAQGNVKPQGTVTVTITGPGGFKKVIKIAYKGKAVKFTTPALKKKGTYKVTVKFSGNNAKDSTSRSTIRVK